MYVLKYKQQNTIQLTESLDGHIRWGYFCFILFLLERVKTIIHLLTVE